MEPPLRVLSLEDDPRDAEIIEATLAAEGIDFELSRIETRAEFAERVERGDVDLILADYTLPAFDGISALHMARRRLPDVPFILVSGTLGETPAIEALTEGATDYVLKNGLSRLGPAVRRAVSESRERAERRRAERAAEVLLARNRFLVRKLLAVQEEERRRLAMELHDEIGQALAAIQAEAEMVHRCAAGADGRVETSAEVILEISSGMYDLIHAIVERLRPPALDHLGLVDAIKDTITAWEGREPEVRCRLSTSGDLSRLGEEIDITIYRIVQEALTNIASHASATEVEVELGIDGAIRGGGRELVLSIRDNGRGIDPEQESRGLGMIGMRERVAAVNGIIDVDSDPGRGVAIQVRVPIES